VHAEQVVADMVDEVLNPNFVCYDPNSESGEVRGSETIKGEIEYFRNAVPDLTYTIEDQIAEGDRMVTRYTASGTHRGSSSALLPLGSGSRCWESWLTA
jgi:predicted ester cyclase